MRGQISLELLVVVFMALVAFSAFSLLAENTRQTSERIAMQNQLAVIARETAGQVASLSMLSDVAPLTEITIPTPQPQAISRNFQETCTIEINNADSVSFVKVTWNPQDGTTPLVATYDTVISDVFDIAIADSTLVNCGQNMVITRV